MAARPLSRITSSLAHPCVAPPASASDALRFVSLPKVVALDVLRLEENPVRVALAAPVPQQDIRNGDRILCINNEWVVTASRERVRELLEKSEADIITLQLLAPTAPPCARHPSCPLDLELCAAYDEWGFQADREPWPDDILANRSDSPAAAPSATCAAEGGASEPALEGSSAGAGCEAAVPPSPELAAAISSPTPCQSSADPADADAGVHEDPGTALAADASPAARMPEPAITADQGVPQAPDLCAPSISPPSRVSGPDGSSAAGLPDRVVVAGNDSATPSMGPPSSFIPEAVPPAAAAEPKPLPRATPPEDPAKEAMRMHEWCAFMVATNTAVGGPLFLLPGDPTYATADFFQAPMLTPEYSDEFMWLLTNGVPHTLRAQVWLRTSGAPRVRAEYPLRYDEIVLCARELAAQTETGRQIRKDLTRTYPGHLFFDSLEAEGTQRLERVLLAFGWSHPAIGYCQGLNLLVGMLLLVLEEEQAFWTLCALVRDRVPADYYSHDLSGLIVDQRVLRRLVKTNLTHLDTVLAEHSIELSLITVNWFLTAFAGSVPENTLVRLWDCFMLEGSLFLFKIALAMLTLRAPRIQMLEDTGALFNALSQTPPSMSDPDTLLKLSFSFMHIEAVLVPFRSEERVLVDQDRETLQRRRQCLATEERVEQSRWRWLRNKVDAMRPRSDSRAGAASPAALTPAVARAGDTKPVNVEQTEKIQHLEAAVELLGPPGPTLLTAFEAVADDGPARATPDPKDDSAIIRGQFRDALAEIFSLEYVGRGAGGKLPKIWDFIEEACYDKDYTKLAATATDLQLDAGALAEAGAALIAVVESINHIPAPVPSKDNKFLVFVCRGVRHGALHLWFAILALTVLRHEQRKWYSKRSFLGSPSWRLVYQLLARVGARPVDTSFEIEA